MNLGFALEGQSELAGEDGVKKTAELINQLRNKNMHPEYRKKITQDAIKSGLGDAFYLS